MIFLLSLSCNPITALDIIESNRYKKIDYKDASPKDRLKSFLIYKTYEDNKVNIDEYIEEESNKALAIISEIFIHKIVESGTYSAIKSALEKTANNDKDALASLIKDRVVESKEEATRLAQMSENDLKKHLKELMKQHFIEITKEIVRSFFGSKDIEIYEKELVYLVYIKERIEKFSEHIIFSNHISEQDIEQEILSGFKDRLRSMDIIEAALVLNDLLLIANNEDFTLLNISTLKERHHLDDRDMSEQMNEIMSKISNEKMNYKRATKFLNKILEALIHINQGD